MNQSEYWARVILLLLDAQFTYVLKLMIPKWYDISARRLFGDRFPKWPLDF